MEKEIRSKYEKEDEKILKLISTPWRRVLVAIFVMVSWIIALLYATHPGITAKEMATIIINQPKNAGYALLDDIKNFYNEAEYLYFCDSEEILDAVKSVVSVHTEDGEGSGFWVSDNLIATSNHGVSFQKEIHIVDHYYGDEYDAEVVQTDTFKDIAILRTTKTPERKRMVLRFRSDWPKLAESVFSIGFPGFSNDINVTSGIVSSMTKNQINGVKYIQTDAAVNPGNSGGPLVDVCGKLIGIISATLRDNENIGFALDTTFFYNEFNRMIESAKNATRVEIDNEQTGEEEEVVAKYYDALSGGIFEKAYSFYSEDLKRRVNFEGWKSSYERGFVIRLARLKKINDGLVLVEFKTIDFPDDNGDLVPKEFSGIWHLAKDDGIWKLNKSNIKEIPLKKDASIIY